MTFCKDIWPGQLSVPLTKWPSTNGHVTTLPMPEGRDRLGKWKNDAVPASPGRWLTLQLGDNCHQRYTQVSHITTQQSLHTSISYSCRQKTNHSSLHPCLWHNRLQCSNISQFAAVHSICSLSYASSSKTLWREHWISLAAQNIGSSLWPVTQSIKNVLGEQIFWSSMQDKNWKQCWLIAICAYLPEWRKIINRMRRRRKRNKNKRKT